MIVTDRSPPDPLPEILAAPAVTPAKTRFDGFACTGFASLFCSTWNSSTGNAPRKTVSMLPRGFRFARASECIPVGSQLLADAGFTCSIEPRGSRRPFRDNRHCNIIVQASVRVRRHRPGLKGNVTRATNRPLSIPATVVPRRLNRQRRERVTSGNAVARAAHPHRFTDPPGASRQLVVGRTVNRIRQNQSCR